MPVAYTAAASRGRRVRVEFADGVANRRQLAESGYGPDLVGAQLAAGRWRLAGQAVVLHDGPLTEVQRREVALLNCGPRAVLTSFTAAAVWALRLGSTRCARARACVCTAAAGAGCPIAPDPGLAARRRCHSTAVASAGAGTGASRLVVPNPTGRVWGASGRRTATPGSPERFAPRARNRFADASSGSAAVGGSRHRTGGAGAQRDRLRAIVRASPTAAAEPAVDRVERSGRRRYLDAEWELRNGRVLAVEVDGAVHLAPERWVEDQLRQNEVVIGGTTVLRFPSVVVRFEPELVVGQLRRALGQS